MNSDDKKKLYAALAAPFPEHAIQRTEGRITGRGYDTTGIGYQFVCNRLNEVLGVGGWRAHRTVTVKEITTAKGRPAYEAICDLTLELGSWTNGEFVVFAESLADGGHTSMSEADARKGAYTNALKKAAAMFGCGRQAYEGTLDDDNVPSDVPSEPPAPTTAPSARLSAQPSASSSTTTSSESPRNRISSKQLSAIYAIGRKLGIDQQGVRSVTRQRFNKMPEYLSREQASTLISSMAAQAGNGHAEEREPGMEG